MRWYLWSILIAALCLACIGVFWFGGEKTILGLSGIASLVAVVAVVWVCTYLFVLAVLAPYFLYRLYRSGLAVEEDVRSMHALMQQAAQRVGELPPQQDEFTRAQEKAAEVHRKVAADVDRQIRRNHLREIRRGRRRRLGARIDAAIARAVGPENTIVIAAIGGAVRVLAVVAPLAGIAVLIWRLAI